MYSSIVVVAKRTSLRLGCKVACKVEVNKRYGDLVMVHCEGNDAR